MRPHIILLPTAVFAVAPPFPHFQGVLSTTHNSPNLLCPTKDYFCCPDLNDRTELKPCPKPSPVSNIEDCYDKGDIRRGMVCCMPEVGRLRCVGGGRRAD